MEQERFIAKIENMGACEESLEWLQNQPDPKTAWDAWMEWLLTEVGLFDTQIHRVEAERDAKPIDSNDTAAEISNWFYDKAGRLRAKRETKSDALWAKFQIEAIPAKAEYADNIRGAVSFDDVLAALTSNEVDQEKGEAKNDK